MNEKDWFATFVNGASQRGVLARDEKFLELRIQYTTIETKMNKLKILIFFFSYMLALSCRPRVY
jgi:hypothetical protein